MVTAKDQHWNDPSADKLYSRVDPAEQLTVFGNDGVARDLGSGSLEDDDASVGRVGDAARRGRSARRLRGAESDPSIRIASDGGLGAGERDAVGPMRMQGRVSSAGEEMATKKEARHTTVQVNTCPCRASCTASRWERDRRDLQARKERRGEEKQWEGVRVSSPRRKTTATRDSPMSLLVTIEFLHEFW